MVLTVSKRKALHEHNLRTWVCKHFHGKIWKTTYLPLPYKFFIISLLIYRWYIFLMEWKRIWNNYNYTQFSPKTPYNKDWIRLLQSQHYFLRYQSYIKMKMEHCAQLSTENQVMAVICCTINRRTQKQWKTAYQTVKLCVSNEYVPKYQRSLSI